MRAAGTELAAANARALVSDWIATHGGQHFRRRLGAGDDGQAHHRLAAAFLGRAAGRGVSVLPRLPEIACRADPLSALGGAARCPTARTGCAPASRWPSRRCRCRRRLPRCAARPATWPRSSTGRSCPTAAISRATRMIVMELLADLLPLRHTYANQAETPPDALINAIERMLPALRFFRHRGRQPRPLQRHGRHDPRPHRRDPAP